MKKNNKIINCIFATIEWIICIVLIILIILTGFQRFSNQGNFFGYRIYTVASGSMIPTYNIGDTLLIKEMDAKKIKIGDAVTYMGESSGVDGMIVTHQVIDVDKDENGKVLFHTKGIANNIEDPIVSEDQVLGKVVHRFFFLSILGRITTNMVSTLVFITIPIAILIAIELIKMFYKKEEDNEEDVLNNKNEKEISEIIENSDIINLEDNNLEDISQEDNIEEVDNEVIEK